MCVWSRLVWRLWRWCRWARWRAERAYYSGNFIPGGNLGEPVFNFNFPPFFLLTILSPMTLSAKAQKRREWDKEWGALSTEGNIWWKGSRYAEWVDVMGVSWLGWICEWSFHLIFLAPFSPGIRDLLVSWYCPIQNCRSSNQPPADPWLYFYQYDPSFGLIYRTLVFTLFFLSCYFTMEVLSLESSRSCFHSLRDTLLDHPLHSLVFSCTSYSVPILWLHLFLAS